MRRSILTKRVAVLMVAIAAVVVVTATSYGASGRNGGGSAEANTFVLGFDGAQTGGIAITDVPTGQGMKIAVDELNKQGGFAGKYKIKLLIKDNKTDAALSAQIAQELIAAKANAVVTACDADLTIAAARLFQGAKIPAITSCASTPTIPEAVGNYMFLNFVGDNAEAAALAQYSIKKGYKRAWTLASSDSLYTTKLPQYFKASFEKLGGKVVGSDQFKLSGGDFSAQVTKIKNANPKPDVIYTPMYPPDTPTLLKQLRAVGVKTPVIGNDGNDNPVIAKASGSAANGFVFATVAFAKPGSPLAALGEKYKKKFGKAPEALSFTGVAYDLVYVLNAAVKKAGSIDGAKVRDALDNLVGFKGITGTYTYKGHGRIPSRPVYLVQVNNGKFSLLSQGIPKDVPKP